MLSLSTFEVSKERNRINAIYLLKGVQVNLRIHLVLLTRPPPSLY